MTVSTAERKAFYNRLYETTLRTVANRGKFVEDPLTLDVTYLVPILDEPEDMASTILEELAAGGWKNTYTGRLTEYGITRKDWPVVLTKARNKLPLAYRIDRQGLHLYLLDDVFGNSEGGVPPTASEKAAITALVKDLRDVKWNISFSDVTVAVAPVTASGAYAEMMRKLKSKGWVYSQGYIKHKNVQFVFSVDAENTRFTLEHRNDAYTRTPVLAKMQTLALASLSRVIAAIPNLESRMKDLQKVLAKTNLTYYRQGEVVYVQDSLENTVREFVKAGLKDVQKSWGGVTTVSRIGEAYFLSKEDNKTKVEIYRDITRK